jgi:hypothetical protein
MEVPEPIITASDITRPLVISMARSICAASTSRPAKVNFVCFNAPDIKQKISVIATHSISHGPVGAVRAAAFAATLFGLNSLVDGLGLTLSVL